EEERVAELRRVVEARPALVHLVEWLRRGCARQSPEATAAAWVCGLVTRRQAARNRQRQLWTDRRERERRRATRAAGAQGEDECNRPYRLDPGRPKPRLSGPNRGKSVAPLRREPRRASRAAAASLARRDAVGVEDGVEVP